MKKVATLFFQGVVVLIGIAALVFMLGEPHFEGRNAHATTLEIYFQDPFLAYAYVASIPFFLGLYQVFRILGCIRRDKAFSQATTKSLRTLKFCGFALIAFVVLGEIFILSNASDDAAGGVVLGILIAFGSAVVAFAAARFERVVRHGRDRKSGSD